MKKIYIISAVLFSLFATAAAEAKDGAYVGGDLALSNAVYRYKNKNNSTASADTNAQYKIDGEGIGFGLVAGYKKSLNQKTFVAPELFYDYLNTSTKSYFHNYNDTAGGFNAANDTMDLRSRYGIKANFGYNLTDKFSPYVTLGLAQVQYINRWPSEASFGVATTEAKIETAPIYGIGALFSVNDNWSVKTEINQQKLHLQYFDDRGTSNVTLRVLKVGAVYNF